jgi:hypothetical protein
MAKFTRKGLHKLECAECDGFGYFTIATLEAKGLPRCGWCEGETMQPTVLELALELGAEDAPVYQAYTAKVNSVAKGQAWTGGDSSGYESPEFRALYGNPKNRKREPGLAVESRVASDRRRRRRVIVEDMPF